MSTTPILLAVCAATYRDSVIDYVCLHDIVSEISYDDDDQYRDLTHEVVRAGTVRVISALARSGDFEIGQIGTGKFVPFTCSIDELLKQVQEKLSDLSDIDEFAWFVALRKIKRIDDYPGDSRMLDLLEG